MGRGFRLTALGAIVVMILSTLQPFTQTVRCETPETPHPTVHRLVDEWDVIPSQQAQIPKLDKTQVIANIKKTLSSIGELASWEAIYRMERRQTASQTGPQIIEASRIRLVSQGKKWFYDTKGETADRTYRVAPNDGEVISNWPHFKEARIEDKDQFTSISPVILSFLPALPADKTLAAEEGFPDILEIVNASETKLLPWRTRVASHECYVLENTTIQRQPIFRSREEADAWTKENPTTVRNRVRVVDIDPNAKPGDVRVQKRTVRLAVDPQLNFMPIRWAEGVEIELRRFHLIVFPSKEVTYTDFREVAKGVHIPRQMTLRRYGTGRRGQRQVKQQTILAVDEFIVNQSYQSALFSLDLPTGYSVQDLRRGIVYVAGDSHEHIQTLLAGVKARNAFYSKLRAEQLPSLQYSRWINSEPINLAECKGRPITLHFWSLGCAPCVRQMPELQRRFGAGQQSGNDSLFISIYPYADGKELKMLEKFITNNGITFPVMVDAPDPEKRSWGRTCMKYRVFSVPTEFKISQDGQLERIDRDLIGASSRWVRDTND